MYLRFTILEIRPDSSRKTGMLVAAHELRDGGKLSHEDESSLRSMLTWFNEHLKIPKLLWMMSIIVVFRGSSPKRKTIAKSMGVERLSRVARDRD